jgi:hypothetical protein
MNPPRLLSAAIGFRLRSSPAMPLATLKFTGTSERCSHEVEQHSSPFELRPILIRTDMSNLNCHFRLLNARRNQPCSFSS